MHGDDSIFSKMDVRINKQIINMDLGIKIESMAQSTIDHSKVFIGDDEGQIHIFDMKLQKLIGEF